MKPKLPEKYTKLTEKQKLFREYYCTPGTDLFGNGFQSYKKAFNAIKSSDNTIMSNACNLLKNPKMKQAIEDFRPKTITKDIKNKEIQREYALTKHQELYLRCFKDHDNTNCVALLRMYWQGAGLLSERLVIDVKDSRKLQDNHQKEAKRIAAIVLETTGIPDHITKGPALNRFNPDINTVSEQFNEPPEPIERTQDVVLSELKPATINGEDFLSDD